MLAYINRSQMIVFIMSGLFSVSLLAEKTSPNSIKKYYLEDTEVEVIKENLPYLDKFQSYLGSFVDETGAWVDDYFVEEEMLFKTRGSRLDVFTPVTFHENGKIYLGVNFRAKIDLPKINKRWNLFVNSTADEVDNIFSDENNRSANTSINQPRIEANAGTRNTEIGLQFKIESKNYTFSFLDLGLNFSGFKEVDSFIRMKGFYKWQITPKFSTKMSQKLFYRRIDNLGLTSRQTFNYALNNLQQLQSETVGTWWDSSQHYDLAQNFFFNESVNKHRTLSYGLGWNWDTLDRGFKVTQFHYRIKWSEKLYKNWLFFLVEPRIDFYKETYFAQADPSITFQIEARFYNAIK